VEQGQRIAILAVDDESGVLALVRRCLADDECVTLIEASSGKDALEHMAKGATFDLLIADLRMPDMEGDEVARRVRSLDAAGDPRRGDLEEIHKAATAALDLLARLYPDQADTPR